jgi:hypothetical protein
MGKVLAATAQVLSASGAIGAGTELAGRLDYCATAPGAPFQ